MSDSSLRLQVEALLEHTSWVRALARRLASDDASADDVEQATWLAALRSPRRDGVPERGWLGAIVRNFARQERRANSRRAEHELHAAVSERLPPSSDVVERAELQRRLVDAVMRLEEPYRTAILLRFFDELTPREIARRTGHPIATVRTHLARGLERLRQQLDREHGGNRGAWIAAFAPLSWRATDPSTATLVATALMNAKLVVAAACISIAALGTWWLTRGAPAPIARATEIADVAAPAESRATTPNDAPSASDERAAVAIAEPAARVAEPAVAAAAPAARAIQGRVLDAHGNHAAGVRLVAHGENRDGTKRELELRSDPSGAFQIADAPDQGVIVSGDAQLSTVMKARFRVNARSEEPVVVVAPRVDFGGRVVDEDGNALADVDLQLTLPEDFRSRFREVLDSSETLAWSATTGADGSFALDDVPQIEGARLTAHVDGFDDFTRAEPEFTDLALSIVLTRPHVNDGWLRGRVVDAAGQPLEGAYVALGVDTLETPADGTFAFRLDDPESFSARFGMPARALVALKRGSMPARFEPPLSGERPAWPSFVTLRIVGEPLSISGTVVDHRGKPLPDVRVFLSDATLFGAVREVGGPVMLEDLLVGEPKRMWNWVETDGEGRFELRGLLERDYVVRAHDSSTLLRADATAVRAGTRGLRLVLPTDQLYLRVAGRVSSYGGAPIAGADIFPMCDAFQARANGSVIATSHDARDGVKTDADGRFELKNVPKSLVYLRVEGENILPLEYGRYVEGDSRFEHAIRELPRDEIEKLDIRVELRCHMQVELRDPASADELAVLDDAGHELVLSLFEGRNRSERQRQPITAGRSTVLGVPDTGRTLVLFRRGVESARMPLRLDPEELVTLRP